MAVLLETSLGDIVIDLFVDYTPKLCENFLKLCKVKYYNHSPIHSIQRSFSFQTGDPLGPLSKESDGGTSVWGLLSSEPTRRTFPAFFHPKLKHLERGTVGMATVGHPSNPDIRLAASQFIVTLGENNDYLDGKSAIFGKVVEGFDVLEAINSAIVDKDGYPLVDIRIKHTVILDDPYPDPAGLREPRSSPPPSRAQLATVRISEYERDRLAEDGLDDEDKVAELEKARREREARAQALTLEMMGDLPFAEIKPPENVLFVCKLNPVTKDSDLELIFSRFGKVLSCEVIRDHKTGDSLQYAFIEFDEKSACEKAYFKMQDVLIDDRRIHVDFSQSVSKLSDIWRHETNGKRIKQAQRQGGWGGVRELEKWRKYRNEYEVEGPVYELVHGTGKDQAVVGDSVRDKSESGDSKARLGHWRERGQNYRDQHWNKWSKERNGQTESGHGNHNYGARNRRRSGRDDIADSKYQEFRLGRDRSRSPQERQAGRHRENRGSERWSQR